MSSGHAKVILVVCDGLGDRPIPELGYLTPLEAARTPLLDQLASEGQSGAMFTVRRGVTPGSDVAHLSLFGYDPDKYYSGRGPIEASGIGIRLAKGDIALRANFATVNDDLSIVDRRAGRIRDVAPFVECLQGFSSGDVEVLVRPGTAHRAVVVLRGPGLSSAISDNDPHAAELPATMVAPTEHTEAAAKTSRVANEFLSWARERLVLNPLNRERATSGQSPANYLLVRGAGIYRGVPSFETVTGLRACCIAGGGLYKGIGAYLGMTVLPIEGATALPDTSIRNKFMKAIESLSEYDFVFVHVKAADSLGEDGNFLEKKAFIERIDDAIPVLTQNKGNCLLIITADHSTPCALMTHSADSVPVLLHGYGIRPDDVTTFGERAACRGGLGMFYGQDLIPQVLNAIGKYRIFGG